MYTNFKPSSLPTSTPQLQETVSASPPQKIRRRTRLPAAAYKLLEESYRKNPAPTVLQRQAILVAVQAIPGCEEYASASLTSWFNNRRTRERKAAKAQSSPAPNQPLLPDALAKLKILYDSSNSITPQLLDTWASLLQVDSLAIAAAISLFQTPASTSGTMYEPPTPQATTSPEPMPLPLYLKTESDRLESPILLEHPMSRIPEATLWTGEPSTSNPLHHNPTFPTTFQPPPLTHNQVEQVIREAGRDAQKSLAGVPPKTLEQFNERFLEYEDTLTGFLGQIKNGELREWGFDPAMVVK